MPQKQRSQKEKGKATVAEPPIEPDKTEVPPPQASDEENQDKVTQMIDTLERSLNNLGDDLKTRFKKLVISQLSLLRYRDKDFNVKFVHAIGNEKEASIVYNKDLTSAEENYRTGEEFLNKNEKGKIHIRQKKERLNELENLSRQKVCTEKDVSTNKASALFPETGQRRPFADITMESEDVLDTNNIQTVTSVDQKPSSKEKQPCRNSFFSISSDKSPGSEGINNTSNVGSSPYKFSECTDLRRPAGNTQKTASGFDRATKRELNILLEAQSRGKQNSSHGRHIRFDTEIHTKYSESTARALQDSGSNIVQIPAHTHCTDVKEVHNKLPSDEQCTSKAPLNFKQSEYYTSNIHHQTNDSDSIFYKSIVSKGLQKDETTDITSERRQTIFANKTLDERSTDKSPVRIVLSPRIRKIQNTLADYSQAQLSTSVHLSTTTQVGVTSEAFPECKVDKRHKLKEKLKDSRERLEKKIPSHATSDNPMTNDAKTTKHSPPLHKLISFRSPSAKAGLESATIDDATRTCKTICGKSESETRNLKTGRTVKGIPWLSRINNIMSEIIELITYQIKDGLKNGLWDDIQADLLSEENDMEDVLSSSSHHNTDMDLEKAEEALKEHLDKMIRLGVKQDADLDYHINAIMMAAMNCGTESHKRELLFGFRNSLKHLHNLTDLLKDTRKHRYSPPDESNEILTRPIATELTHPPSMDKEEHQSNQTGVSSDVYPNVSSASTAAPHAASISSPRFSIQPSSSPPYNCIQLPENIEKNRQTYELEASWLTQKINHRHELQHTKTSNENLYRQKLNTRCNYKCTGYRTTQLDTGTTSLSTSCVFVLGFCVAVFLVVLVLWFLPNAGKAWLWLCSYLACNVKVVHTSSPVV